VSTTRTATAAALLVTLLLGLGCGKSGVHASLRLSNAQSARITFLQYATLRLAANIDPTAAEKTRTLKTFNQGIPWLIELCRHEPDAVTIGGKTVIQRLKVELRSLAYSPRADARAKVRAAVEDRCS
jgi:hypothetical protein